MKKTYVLSWFLFVATVTALSGLVYVTAQQSLRQSANDPQIQMAQDIAAALAKGKTPADYNKEEKVDIGGSLATFIIIYDAQNRPVASTGELDGATPVPPAGVFLAAKSTGEDRITWQPRKDVRIALVVVPYSGGFVAVGRSLREIELRENSLLTMVGIVWAISILIASAIFLAPSRKNIS